MAIVYRHRRLDDNTVFYVGIGKTKVRAYKKKRRSTFWNNIIDKTDYSVEIIQKGISWEDACDLEQLLISEYGRRDLGTGCLVNMTDGGEGVLGLICKEETRNKLRQHNLGKKHTKETRELMSKSNTRYYLGKKLSKSHREKISKARVESKAHLVPVIQYSKEGAFINNFSSVLEASSNVKIHCTGISKVCAGKQKTAGGFIWKYKEKVPKE